MALKGALDQFGMLDESIAHLHNEMDQGDPRVPRLEARARQHLAGPANTNLDTIQTWREEARAIYRQTEALSEAIDAANALNQYLVDNNIGFFQRTQQIQNWFVRMGEERPNPIYAAAVRQWLYDRAVEHALQVVEHQDMPMLQHIHDHIIAYWSPQDPRVLQLENDVTQLLAGPQPVLDVIRAWQAQAQVLNQRFQDLATVLRARRDLDAFSREHNLNIFNRPRQFGQWYENLAADPPNAIVGQQVIDWVAQQRLGQI